MTANDHDEGFTLMRVVQMTDFIDEPDPLPWTYTTAFINLSWQALYEIVADALVLSSIDGDRMDQIQSGPFLNQIMTSAILRSAGLQIIPDMHVPMLTVVGEQDAGVTLYAEHPTDEEPWDPSLFVMRFQRTVQSND